MELQFEELILWESVVYHLVLHYIGKLTCLFCIELKGDTHVEYHLLLGHQVQCVEFLNLWIRKLMVKRNLTRSQFTL